MATFEKRNNGWRAKIRLKGVNESATFYTKAEALAWAVDREREIIEFERSGVIRKTLAQALKRYAEEVSPTKRGTHWETLRLNKWVESMPFANKLLSEISPDDVGQWRDKRLKEKAVRRNNLVSPGTVCRELNLLCAVFTQCRTEWRWVKASPMGDVKRPKTPEHRRRRISEKEIDKLSIAMGWDRAEMAISFTQQVAVAFCLGIETAMRKGEMLGLTWDRVNFVRCVAHLPITKNGSARDVPLSVEALRLFNCLPRSDDPTSKVFQVDSASCDALFRKAKQRAMIKDLRFHDSRREATSRMSAKVEVLTLARITGHKDLKTLMIYYEEDMSAVAARLN